MIESNYQTTVDLKMNTGRIYILSVFLSVLIYNKAQGRSIWRRAATEEKELYVFAERDGRCVSVDSVEPCPVTWKLSATSAKFYKQQAHLTNIVVNGLESLSVNDECKNAIKTTMCGQAAPKCSADGSQDYGDVATACPKIYSQCPPKVSELFKLQKLCEKVNSGIKAKPKCITPPRVEGNCPQPTYKMPSDAWSLYERFSADNETVQTLAQVQASPQCTSKVKKMQCIAVYCSDDEKYLLTESTKTECDNTIKPCITGPLEILVKGVPFLEPQLRPTIEKFQESCNVYPVTATKQTAPHTVGTPSPGATDKVL